MAMDKNIKILLVEDSKITRKMEVKVLNDLGFNNIVEADDGEHAVKLLEKHGDLAVVISDWNMPSMGGLELLKWVRSSDKYRHLPFILATGRAQKKEVAEASEAGASNIITKPFAPVELMKVIENTFSGKTLQNELSEQVVRKAEKDERGRLLLNIAHIQITDHLTLGMAKHLISTGKVEPRHFSLKTHCMTSWNPVQSALEKGEIDGALVLAPIAMDLFAYGVPVKIVLFAHKNGSICVRKKAPLTNLSDFFKAKTFCIPHELSIHHVLSHMFMKALGLQPGIAGLKEGDFFYEVVPPVKMPEFLKMNPDASGFLVAEPIGTKAIAEGIADQLFLSAEVWQNHPCCVVALRSEIVDNYGEAVEEFIKLMVEAGDLISRKPEMAAEVGVNFLDPQKILGLKIPILKNVITESQGIKTDDLVPDRNSLEAMQAYMNSEMNIDLSVDFSSFVDTSFANRAYGDRGGYSPRTSRFNDIQRLVEKVLREVKEEKLSAKSLLGQEGKYLIFNMANNFYGVDILYVKEIITIISIREIPQAPPFIKGVINLRGRVIPVVDLRLKLNMPETPYDEKTCIIILEIPFGGSIFNVGIVVDTVSHVETIKAKDVEPTPSMGFGRKLNFIRAMAKTDGKIKILLDAVNLFEKSELDRLSGAQ